MSNVIAVKHSYKPIVRLHQTLHFTIHHSGVTSNSRSTRRKENVARYSPKFSVVLLHLNIPQFICIFSKTKSLQNRPPLHTAKNISCTVFGSPVHSPWSTCIAGMLRHNFLRIWKCYIYSSKYKHLTEYDKLTDILLEVVEQDASGVIGNITWVLNVNLTFFPAVNEFWKSIKLRSRTGGLFFWDKTYLFGLQFRLKHARKEYFIQTYREVQRDISITQLSTLSE